MQAIAARSGAGWVSAVCLLVAAGTAVADRDGEASGIPGPDQTVLRVARSIDGLHFEDTGEVLAVGAASPDLTVLPNGDLLLLFDRGTGLSVVRSRDSGRSFSSVRRVRIRGAGRAVQAKHGDLVALPGGQYRLFFACPTNGRGDRSPTGVVRSALTRDGINYSLDRSLHLPLPKGEDLHPVAGWIGDRLHVLAGSLGPVSQSRSGLHRVISKDGERFAGLAPLPMSDVSFAGSMILIDGGARAFVSGEGGMRILESREGRTWRRRRDVHLPVGWDPGVVETKRGRYLMVYCAPRTDEAVASSGVISFDTAVDDWADMPDGGTEDEAAEVLVDAAEAEAVGPEQPLMDGLSEALAPDGEDPAAVPLLEDFGADGGTLAGYDPAMTGGYAPLPDFITKVHYMQWYEDYALGDPDDNAFYAYEAFIPGAYDKPGDKPAWPELNHMFNSEGHQGPPGPWDPATHPEWEASSLRAADLSRSIEVRRGMRIMRRRRKRQLTPAWIRSTVTCLSVFCSRLCRSTGRRPRRSWRTRGVRRTARFLPNE